MSSTKSLFEGLGFPMKNYLEESFGGPKAPRKMATQIKADPAEVAAAPANGQGEPSVVFANSDREVSCDREDSLLDVAEQAGIDLPSGCRMGSCGVCKHQLLEGDVEYDDEPGSLSDSDRQNNQVLVCVARPVGRVVLSA